MLRFVAAVAACSLASPAMAANLCIDKGSFERMSKNLGMELTAEATMKDPKGTMAVYLMTDGKGGWQTFYTRDGLMMCMLVGGEDWSAVEPVRGEPA